MNNTMITILKKTSVVLIPLLVISAIVFISTATRITHASTNGHAMYLWTSAQTTYTAEFIENYLIQNNVTTAMVSLSSASRPVFKQLLARLPDRGIRFEILVGSNSLLFNTNPSVYFDNLLKNIDTTKISAIHLDVEPQTFSDYQQKKGYYLNLYTNLLEKTKVYATSKGMQLSVDIPVYFPQETLEKIYKQADKVYLMAYQIQSMNYLKTRTQEEVAQGIDKTVFAFRANDFANRGAFETYTKNAETKLGTISIALHDLTRFVTLDKQP